MVNFKKLRQAKPQQTITDPIEIFRRLPKPPGINDLYTSQAEALNVWNARRAEKDNVLKLHTGGGKTLVGLLIAQSIMNETGEPALYLVPTNQLLEQTCDKAREYGIAAEPFQSGQEFSEDVMNGKSVLIANYQAVFNGKSRFRMRGQEDPFLPAAIIADDAHVALTTMREQFTLRVERTKDPDGYAALTTLFRNDFKDIGRLGTYDDIIQGAEYSVLEVPYWSWQARTEAVREHLQPNLLTLYKFTWPLLRDALDYCHCLVSKDAIAITPLFPLTDLFPTFADCKRRIFMSATIGDDSAIVRTFDANPESVSKPITSRSLAGVSERMILSPDLMGFGAARGLKLIREVIEKTQKTAKVGVAILVPSSAAAKPWTDVADFADATDKVTAVVRELQEGTRTKPVVLANRYDGIDLPGDACRVLVMDGLPKGTTEYDRYLAVCMHGGTALASTLAQRIEQGIGRAARGSGDYCVVFMVGRDLNAWIGRSSNSKALTSSTRAQLTIGQEVSRDVSSADDMFETVRRCLKRDKDWTEYHAETLAELTGKEETPVSDLAQASLERDCFRLWRDGHGDKAIGKIAAFIADNAGLDRYSVGWLLQSAARMAHAAGQVGRSQGQQKDAYAKNANLLRPQTGVVYERLARPGKQAERIVSHLATYRPRRAFMAHFEEVVAHLTASASSNQFEEALKELGQILGFEGQRPERTYGVGPDVLWLLGGNPPLGLVIEAKSRKTTGLLTKEDHGQLLTAEQWFKGQYAGDRSIRVSIIPKPLATPNASADDSFALTLAGLQELIGEARELLTQVVSIEDNDQMVLRCEQLLQKSSLKPEALVSAYLKPFTASKK